MKHASTRVDAFLVFVVSLLTASAIWPSARADDTWSMDTDKAQIAQYWTKQRLADAIPRDLVIDHRGLGYLKKPDGTLIPYGHQLEADVDSRQATPLSRPGSGGSGDTTPPSISGMDPNGNTIGASYTFAATVTDDSGIKSVSFVIQYPNGLTQSFSPTVSGDTWSVGLSGFTDGNWAWQVVAKDLAGRGGNTATSVLVPFTVDTASGGSTGVSGGTSSDTVTNAEWTTADSTGGAVQTASGRLYFEMPSNAKWKGPWTGYVCSGTVVQDSTGGRSIILTAAHCVYDDMNKAFARNVMFIPNQSGTTGSGTDLNCNNDPLGCWVPSFGVVDVNWTTRTFPDNIQWDYANYVVDDSDAHFGADASLKILDQAAGVLPVKLDADPVHDDGQAGESTLDFTYALGYSYSDDPNFMYCAEDMTTEGEYNWWLPNCGLSGGSSGGPWVQPMDPDLGDGPVISVNSWGYTNQPGMAGPKLSSTSAGCVFDGGKSTFFANVPTADGKAGVAVTCQ